VTAHELLGTPLSFSSTWKEFCALSEACLQVRRAVCGGVSELRQLSAHAQGDALLLLLLLLKEKKNCTTPHQPR